MSPSGTIREPLQHTFLAPAFAAATVVDAMRLGVVSCPADTPLQEAARIMATYRIHCVVISDLDSDRPLGVVSDLDLVAAAGDDLTERTVRDVARGELISVRPDDSLTHAAQLMTENEVAHLLVVQPHSGHPVGVISTLDLAGVLAWGGTA
jgi:CBS domain-containing protein